MGADYARQFIRGRVPSSPILESVMNVVVTDRDKVVRDTRTEHPNHRGVREEGPRVVPPLV